MKSTLLVLAIASAGLVATPDVVAQDVARALARGNLTS